MPRLNWEIIGYNIADARKEPERIENRIQHGRRMSETEFEIAIDHAFHHLCFAWNARHQSIKRYQHLSDSDFEAWGQFPSDLPSYLNKTRDCPVSD